MTPFAGWEMPVQYTSIIEEHMAVREKAGLFDVSHMGEIHVKGPEAAALLDATTCNTVADIPIGRVRYNAVLNDRGGLVDDITIYRRAEQSFLVVSNASNYARVFRHLQDRVRPGVVVEDHSLETHLIAIQGPAAERTLSAALARDLSGIVYYAFQEWEEAGASFIVSRTGYTGEDGFEIYSSNERGVRLWDELLEAGSAHGLLPVGLGARDTLRLEAGYPLYGHELSDELTPVESGLGWIVKEKAGAYPHQERLLKQKAAGADRLVVGVQLSTGGVPREGYAVLDRDGQRQGQMLSGGYSPVLKAGIGTALLPRALTEPGTALDVEIRGKPTPAQVRRGPFVKGGAGKKR